MQKEINYEDNLFFLINQMEQLQTLLNLNLDADYLCDKYILDINFYEKTLQRIEESILEHNRLINFNQYMQLLRRSRSALQELLISLKFSDKKLALQFREKLKDELEELIEHQEKSLHILISKLRKNIETGNQELEATGIDEMLLLLDLEQTDDE